jgi:hypothetical protein
VDFFPFVIFYFSSLVKIKTTKYIEIRVPGQNGQEGELEESINFQGEKQSEYKNLFKYVFFNDEFPHCNILNNLECPYGFINPLTTFHHDFFYTNFAASSIILIRYILKLSYQLEVFILFDIVLILMYLFFSVFSMFLGVVDDEVKGLDSFFAAFLYMSVPLYVIPKLSGVTNIMVNNNSLSLPLMLPVINFIILILLYIYRIAAVRVINSN